VYGLLPRIADSANKQTLTEPVCYVDIKTLKDKQMDSENNGN